VWVLSLIRESTYKNIKKIFRERLEPYTITPCPELLWVFLGNDIMNTTQAKTYRSICKGYKNDPRWLQAKEIMADSATDPEDYAWAQEKASSLEQSAKRSAEQARIGGL
jgi:hypothetical protein